MVLQMTVKTVSNTAGPNSLVPTFLVFGAYLCMTEFDAPTPTITQCIKAIKNVMKKVQKIRVER